MLGVDSFLTFRSPPIKITDTKRVVPLATNGGNVLLATYHDRASGGLLVTTGLGESFLFGVHNVADQSRSFETLAIMKNVIAYVRSLPNFVPSVPTY
jgi:hypothetical protein